MWAVFRYSTDRIYFYMAEEKDAATYCEINNQFDFVNGAPDWGYRQVRINEMVDEMCNGLDA